MTQKFYYQVAGHVFLLELPTNQHIIDEMGQYAPFVVPATDNIAFAVEVVPAEQFPDTSDMTIELHQDDDAVRNTSMMTPAHMMAAHTRLTGPGSFRRRLL